jgi:hypothetical protein
MSIIFTKSNKSKLNCYKCILNKICCLREQEKQKKLAKTVKSLEKYLRSTINMAKSQLYEDYKYVIDK